MSPYQGSSLLQCSVDTFLDRIHKKILIVDDEPYNLMGLKIMLQQSIKGCFGSLWLKAEGDQDQDGKTYDLADCEIHKATNGLEAFQKV